jgi:hypothetical protein
LPSVIALDKGISAAILEPEEGEEIMIASDSLRKGRRVSLLVAFIVLSAFTADIFDLRDEPNIIPSLSADLENGVAAVMVNGTAVEPEPVRTLCPVQRKKPLAVSSLCHVPCGFRAPPSLV